MTNQLTKYLIGSAIRNAEIVVQKAWESGEAVILGTIRVSMDKKYIATTNGKTGFIRPSHAVGEMSDGGVVWLYVERVSSGFPQLDNLYMVLGDITGTPKEDELLSKSFYASKVTAANMRFGVRCKEWVNEIIPAYPNPQSVVVNVFGDVFVCLSSGEVSTVEPTGQSDFNFMTSDNHVWRYLFTVDSTDSDFVTPDFVPLKSISNPTDKHDIITSVSVVGQSGDFSTGEFENDGGVKLNYVANESGFLNIVWDSLNNSLEKPLIRIFKKGEIGNGAIANAGIENGEIKGANLAAYGQDYTNGAVAFVVGDGNGAELKCNTDALGAITSIEVLNGGQDYTKADIFIVSGKTGAVAQVTVTKSDIVDNMLSYLDSKTLIISKRIQDKTGMIESGDTYNNVSLMTNLYTLNNDIAKENDYKTADLLPNVSLVVYNREIAQKTRVDGQTERIQVILTLN